MARTGNAAQGVVEAGAAVAAQGTEGIAEQAFTVDSDQGVMVETG